jgi:16S rRNA (guanine966-N2)-methyltransferase
MAGRAGGTRIAAGALRGRRLAVPPGARPTEGRVREALLSIWQDRLDGARLLDLYAGSGAVGLEALSRGAAVVVFVESDRAALRALARNCALAEGGRAIRRRASLPGGLAVALADQAPFGLVFADPPYRFAAHAGLLLAIEPHLAAGGEVALEHAARGATPETAGALVRHAVRRYGESALSFYRRTPATRALESGDDAR